MCILLFFSVQFKTNVKILSRFVLKRKTCSVEIKLNQNEMPCILTIVVANIIHACICNLKWMSNIDIQQDYLTRKDSIWFQLCFNIRQNK